MFSLCLKLMLLTAIISVSLALEQPDGGEEDPSMMVMGSHRGSTCPWATHSHGHQQPVGLFLKRVFLLGGEGGDKGRSSAETGGDPAASRSKGRVLHWRGEGAEASLDTQVDAEVWRAAPNEEGEGSCLDGTGGGAWPCEEPAFFSRGSGVAVIGELAWPLRLRLPHPPPSADERHKDRTHHRTAEAAAEVSVSGRLIPSWSSCSPLWATAAPVTAGDEQRSREALRTASSSGAGSGKGKGRPFLNCRAPVPCCDVGRESGSASHHEGANDGCIHCGGGHPQADAAPDGASSPAQQQLFNVTCRSSGGLPTRRPGLLRLCLSWRLLPRSQPDGDAQGGGGERGGEGGGGEGGLEGEEEAAATAVSSHVLGLSWRSPLAEPRLYRETGLRAAAALAAAPPGAELLREGEAGEPSNHAPAEIMRFLLEEVRRWAEDGGPSYGIWQRPPGLVEGSQVWHLLRNGSGLCGELSALLASMAAFHGLRSTGLKVCFADSTAVSAVLNPPEDAPPDSRGPGVWFLHTKSFLGADEGVRRQGAAEEEEEKKGSSPGRHQQRRHAALGLPALYGFDYVDHSAIEVVGRIYDATYGVEAESWSDYMALMASVQWDFCRCDGEWGDSGCVEPGAAHVKAATECFALDPASLASMRPEDVMAAVAAEGPLPLQVLRYDIQGAEPSAVVFGRERRYKCTTPRRPS